MGGEWKRMNAYLKPHVQPRLGPGRGLDRHLSRGASLAMNWNSAPGLTFQEVCSVQKPASIFPVNYQQVGEKGTKQNVIYNLKFITEKGSAVIVRPQSFQRCLHEGGAVVSRATFLAPLTGPNPSPTQPSRQKAVLSLEKFYARDIWPEYMKVF